MWLQIEYSSVMWTTFLWRMNRRKIRWKKKSFRISKFLCATHPFNHMAHVVKWAKKIRICRTHCLIYSTHVKIYEAQLFCVQWWRLEGDGWQLASFNSSFRIYLIFLFFYFLFSYSFFFGKIVKPRMVRMEMKRINGIKWYAILLKLESFDIFVVVILT